MKNQIMRGSFFGIFLSLASVQLCAMHTGPLAPGRIIAPPYLSAVTVTGSVMFKTAEDLVYECVEARNTVALQKLLSEISQISPTVMSPPLPYGLNFYRSFNDIRTPLYRAIELNFLDVAYALLASGASPNQQCIAGNTPLFYAVTKCNYDAVVMLLPGSDPNITNSAGFTPLLALAEAGNNGIEKAIRDRCGSEVLINVDSVRLSIAQLLVSRGADVNARMPGGMSVINFLCRDAAQLPVSLITYLIENGLDLTAAYAFGKTNYQALEELGIDAINAALLKRQSQPALASVRLLPSAVSADVAAAEADVSAHAVVPEIPALTPQQIAAQRQAKKEAKAAVRAQRQQAEAAAKEAAHAVASSQPSGAHKALVAAAAPAQKSLSTSIVAASHKAVEAKPLHVAPAHKAPAAMPPAAASGSSKKAQKGRSEQEEDLDALAKEFQALNATQPPVYNAPHGRQGKKTGRTTQGAVAGATATYEMSDVASSDASARAMASPAPVKSVAQPYDYSRASGILSGDIPLTALADDELIALPEMVACAAETFRPESVFLQSIFDGDDELVLALLDEDPGLVRQITPQGNTALHLAASINDLTLCQLLCERGADVHAKNFLDETPLMKVFDLEFVDAEVRAAAVFKYLVSRGARCDVTNSCHMNLLHYAVSSEYCALTEYLSATLPANLLKAMTLDVINFCTENAGVVEQLCYSRPLHLFDFVLYKQQNQTRRYLFKLLVDRLGLCELIKPLIPYTGGFDGNTGADILRIFKQYELCRSEGTLDHLYQTAHFCSTLELKNKQKIAIVNPLYAAVLHKDNSRLRQLCATNVTATVNLTYKQQGHVSPLQFAAARFDLAAVAVLLKAGAAVNYATPEIPCNGEPMGAVTALHVVAAGGDTDDAFKALSSTARANAVCTMINLLVKHRADVNAITSTGIDPLTCVLQSSCLTENEKIEVISCLHKNHANFKVIYPGNHTILHYAATKINAETGSAINLVRAVGDCIPSDPEFYGRIYDGASGLDGTALGIALQKHDWATALYLFEKGGVQCYIQDPAARERVMAHYDLVTDAVTIENFFAVLRSECFQGYAPVEGQTGAAASGAIDWATFFLPPALDQSDLAHLSDAEYEARTTPQTDWLLEELQLAETDHFLRAVFNQDYSNVRQMLAADKSLVNASISNGATALHLAAVFGNLPICKALITAGADPKVCDKQNITPINSLVASVGRSEAVLLEILNLLLQAGAVVEATKDVQGLTALHAAVSHKRYALLDRLCQHAGACIQILMKKHCNKRMRGLGYDGFVHVIDLPKTFSAPHMAYQLLCMPALEIFMRYAQCTTLAAFLDLIEVEMPDDYLRSEVLKRKWTALWAAATPDARRVCLEAICRTLHSFKKPI